MFLVFYLPEENCATRFCCEAKPLYMAYIFSVTSMGLSMTIFCRREGNGAIISVNGKLSCILINYTKFLTHLGNTKDIHRRKTNVNARPNA